MAEFRKLSKEDQAAGRKRTEDKGRRQARDDRQFNSAVQGLNLLGGGASLAKGLAGGLTKGAAKSVATKAATKRIGKGELTRMDKQAARSGARQRINAAAGDARQKAADSGLMGKAPAQTRATHGVTSKAVQKATPRTPNQKPSSGRASPESKAKATEVRKRHFTASSGRNPLHKRADAGTNAGRAMKDFDVAKRRAANNK